MTDLLGLSAFETGFLIVAVFLAGVVRGFSGFALSALVLASTVWILPPIALIPICWFLEVAASALMLRGGVRDAHFGIVAGLVIGSALGVPLGLMLTKSVSVGTSSMIALGVVLVLALAQLMKLRLGFLATRPGLYATGLTAGIITGLANVGGLVVALYVLASDAPARVMRASLVMFLFFSELTSFVTLSLFGLFTQETVLRGLLLALPTMAGVFCGKAIFRPEMEKYYRPFCLSLLIFLAGLGLLHRTL